MSAADIITLLTIAAAFALVAVPILALAILGLSRRCLRMAERIAAQSSAIAALERRAMDVEALARKGGL